MNDSEKTDDIEAGVNRGSNLFFRSAPKPEDPIAALAWENARDYWNRRIEIIENARKREGDR